MQTKIAFDSIPGIKKLFLDYLSGAAAEFYRYPFTSQESFASVQQQLNRRSFRRDEIVAALLRQNRQYGAGEKTIENINKLLDPSTIVVFTGQQVTVFGGTLLTFYKASLAVKLATGNCQTLGAPVVPIFWLAADDADFAEVATVTIPGKENDVVELRYRPDQPVEGQPMGSVRLDGGIVRLLDEYEQALPDTEFRGELMARLRDYYQPGESIVTAFAKYLIYLFRDQGLILIDPSDIAFRRLAAPVFRKELAIREKGAQLVEQRNRRLEERGYHLQVAKSGSYSNLYYCDDKRTRIDFAADGFQIDGKSFSQAQLEEQVEQRPELFSPNVFLRAIVQSHIFPTLVYFAGPAEAAYFAQIGEMFELFDEVAPIIYPRFSATIIEPSVARLMEKQSLTFDDFTRDLGELTTEVMRRTFPLDSSEAFTSLRDETRRRLDVITQKLDQSDHGLLTNATRIAGRIDLEIKNLEEKVFQAHRKRNQTVRTQLERAGYNLFPAHKMQERVFPLNYYIAKHGFSIVSRLYHATNCDSKVHHLIYLDEPQEDKR